MTPSWTREKLAATIDHSLLKAVATSDQIMQLCREARQYGFAAVCINSFYVPLAVRELKVSKVTTCTVIGFPWGPRPPRQRPRKPNLPPAGAPGSSTWC